MKMDDGKGFIPKLIKFFATKGGKITGVAALLVVCVVTASVVAVVNSNNGLEVDGDVSSEVSSEEVSSEEVSSEEVSSEPESSEEVSSEEVSSEEVSSEEVSSAPESKPESKPVSKPPVSSAAVSSAPASSTASENQNVNSDAGMISSDWQNLLQKAPNVKGQVYLAGTKLNYYVAQGKDNYYYLNHNAYNQYSGWGTPYADFRAYIGPDGQSTNITIYGHSNDKTGEHLSATKNYQNLDFYKAHPTIDFNTIYGDGTYKVIGMFLENVDVPGKSFAYHDFVNAKDENSFNAFVNEVKGRSFITMPVDAEYGDHFITFSTCYTSTSKHCRYVTVARKVREGESTYVDTSLAEYNQNQIPMSGPKG